MATAFRDKNSRSFPGFLRKFVPKFKVFIENFQVLIETRVSKSKKSEG